MVPISISIPLLALILAYWAYISRKSTESMKNKLYDLGILLGMIIGSVVLYLILYFIAALAVHYYIHTYVYTAAIGVVVLTLLKRYYIAVGYFAGHIIALIVFKVISEFKLAYTGGILDYYRIMGIPRLIIVVAIVIAILIEYHRAKPLKP